MSARVSRMSSVVVSENYCGGLYLTFDPCLFLLLCDLSCGFRRPQSSETGKLGQRLHQRKFSDGRRSQKSLYSFSGTLQYNQCEWQCLQNDHLKTTWKLPLLPQGPLRNTCGHFWLMIWEQCTKAVIMLNRVIEKGSVSTIWHLLIVSLSCFLFNLNILGVVCCCW